MINLRLVSKFFNRLCLECIEKITFDAWQLGEGNLSCAESPLLKMNLIRLVLTRPFRLLSVEYLYIDHKKVDEILAILSNCKYLQELSVSVDFICPHRSKSKSGSSTSRNTRSGSGSGSCEVVEDGEGRGFGFDLTSINEDVMSSFILSKLQLLGPMPKLSSLNLQLFFTRFERKNKIWRVRKYGGYTTSYFTCRRDFQILVNCFKIEAFSKAVLSYLPALETLILNEITLFPLAERGYTDTYTCSDLSQMVSGFNDDTSDDEESDMSDMSISDWPYYNFETDPWGSMHRSMSSEYESEEEEDDDDATDKKSRFYENE